MSRHRPLASSVPNPTAIPLIALISIGDGYVIDGLLKVYNNSPEKFNVIGKRDSVMPFEVLFTGLIINQKPVWGMINAPAKGRLFFTLGSDSREIRGNETYIKLTCVKKTKQDQIKAVTYSENLKPSIAELHKKYGVTECRKMKSSLKFCAIAAGEFDLYVAEPRACEWDIAAGHAILKNAGGLITDFESKEVLYGKKNFKNPSLILKRSALL